MPSKDFTDHPAPDADVEVQNEADSITDEAEFAPGFTADSDTSEATKDNAAAAAQKSPLFVPVIMRPERWYKRAAHAYWRRKLLTIPLTVLLLAVVIVGLPQTRYHVLGTFIARDYAVTVMDSNTHRPVSGAEIKIRGETIKTNADGQARFHVAIGTGTALVTKKYYRTVSQTVLVPLKQKGVTAISLAATGRQVPFIIVDKITSKPLAGVTLTAAGTEAVTDKAGKATIVLPADKSTVPATLRLKGMNDTSVMLKVSEQTDPANSFAMTATGWLYFLSRQTGKIDVVKTKLDGSDRQTVLAGTGKENTLDTVLLASRDWKYLALKSTRDDATKTKLYLINTATDKLSVMDEGDASFQPVGWSGHTFVYQVNRNGFSNWQPKAQALKSYNAETSHLATIDETDATGTNSNDYTFNLFSQVYILNNELVYAKNWYAAYGYGNLLDGKQISLFTAKPDGTDKKAAKTFTISGGGTYMAITTRLYEPQGVYFSEPSNGGQAKLQYFEYEDGTATSKPDTTDQQFNSDYPTYLLSPSGNSTFWTDERDGKNVLFVGNDDAENAKQIASLSEYTPYGWYSDSYVLLSKNSSELYIMSAAGGTPLKVSDYHKPNFDSRGYGYGYGGF